MSKHTIKRLALSVLRTDGGTQCRENMSSDTVQEYVEALEAGAEFPPVDAFFDGKAYWLADGFQRIAAALKAGQKEFLVNVHKGSVREAILFAVGANSTHGLRRSNNDKRRAVRMLLEDEEWMRWSDREIARRCGVSDRFVNGQRAELSANGSQMRYRVVERTVQRNSRTYIMKTKTAAPRSEPEPEPEPEPERKILGKGVFHAHEAINCLQKIRPNDALRKRGFQIVEDWIRHSK